MSYLNIRYVVLDAYKMPGAREREGTLRYAMAALAGATTPAYQDERLTVYRIEPPSALRPFMVLGSGWGPRLLEGETPWRRIAAAATIEVHTAAPTTLSLRLTARSQMGGTLVVGMPEGEEVSRAVGKQPQAIAVGPLALAAGVHRITLSVNEPIEVTGLDLDLGADR